MGRSRFWEAGKEHVDKLRVMPPLVRTYATIGDCLCHRLDAFAP